MSRQVSKSVAFMLFDEEVEVWKALEKYAEKKELVVWSRPETRMVSSQRLMREVLRLAAERVADEIGHDVAAKLALPRPYAPRGGRQPAPKKVKPAKAGRRRQSEKEPDTTPTNRVFWDRPWTPRKGDL